VSGPINVIGHHRDPKRRFLGQNRAYMVTALVCDTGLRTPSLALKLLRNIARGVCNRSTNFGVSRTFRSRLNGQHLSDASRDLVTLTFTLEVTALVCVPSLKFVGLPIRKIWRTSGLSISRPGDLDFWPLTLNLGRIILIFLSFSTDRLTPARRITWRCDLDLWPWRSQRLSLGSSCSVCVPSLKFVGLPISQPESKAAARVRRASIEGDRRTLLSCRSW